MKKKLCFLIAALSISSIFAQNTEDFKPEGKPFVHVFANYHHTFEDGKNAPAFELNRAYFGYNFKYSKNISGQVKLAVGDPRNDSQFKYTAYLKTASLNYKKDKLSASFGLIGLTQFDLMVRTWKHRYVSKAFQDRNNFGNSADLGGLVKYNLHKAIDVDLSLTNGEGYKNLQRDSSLKVAAGLTLKPTDRLTFRAYYDYINNNNDPAKKAQSTVSAFIGYMSDRLAIGAEYDIQNNNKMTDGYNYNGFSVYSTYQLTPKIDVFGRLDYLTSDKVSIEVGETENKTTVKEAWNISKDGQVFIFGVEYMPIKNIRFAPNFEGFQSAVKDSKFISIARLDFEFKF